MFPPFESCASIKWVEEAVSNYGGPGEFVLLPSLTWWLELSPFCRRARTSWFWGRHQNRQWNTASIFSTPSYTTAETDLKCFSSVFPRKCVQWIFFQAASSWMCGHCAEFLGHLVPRKSHLLLLTHMSCPSCLDPYNWGCILLPAEVLFTPPSPGFQPCHAISADLWHFPPRLGLPAMPALSTVSCCCWQFSRVLYTHLWQRCPCPFRILYSYVIWFVLVTLFLLQFHIKTERGIGSKLIR